MTMVEEDDVDRPHGGYGLSTMDPILLGPEEEDWDLDKDPGSEDEVLDDWDEYVEEFTQDRYPEGPNCGDPGRPTMPKVLSDQQLGNLNEALFVICEELAEKTRASGPFSSSVVLVIAITCQLLFQFPYSCLQGLGVVVSLSQVFLGTNGSTLPLVGVLTPYPSCCNVFIVPNEFGLHDVSAVLHARITPPWVIYDVEAMAPTPAMVVPVVPVHCHWRTLLMFSSS
jgi:hypothetical protein